jgi:undecaprenyl-diphosphatase
MYLTHPTVRFIVDIVTAILLGILQGLTEWLPISSSGHLALAQHFIEPPPLVFDILLHFGTLIVLVYYFRKDIQKIRIAIFSAIRDMRKGEEFMKAATKNRDRKSALFILIGIFPTALFGLIFEMWFIETAYTNLLVVGVSFSMSALIIGLTRRSRGNKSLMKTNEKVAFFIGVAQGIAIAPGISRSGATIGVGMLNGMDGEAAGRISFLMAVPAILGAMLLHVPDLFEVDMSVDMLPYIAGTISAMIVGYLCLALLMRILKGRSFHLFSIYCLGAGIFTLAIVFAGL